MPLGSQWATEGQGDGKKMLEKAHLTLSNGPTRRSVVSGLAATGLGACAFSGKARAAGYPERVIKLIVPFPAGSATDSEGRFLAEQVGKSLNATVIVENKAGANGNLAAQFVAKAAPDGYTLLLATNSSHSANVHLYKTLNFDPVRDFAPVARLTRNPLVLVVNPASGISDLKGLLRAAKEAPSKLNYGTGNTGSHVAVQLLLSLGNIEAVRVPYQGTPQAITDLIGGRIDFVITDVAVVRPFVQSGALRALGVSTAQPLRTLPGVPTIAHAGLPGYDFAAWSGLFAPAGTPDQIVTMLDRAFEAALAGPEADRFFDVVGLEPDPGTPEVLRQHVVTQTEIWGTIIAQTGLEKT
ncbi:MAG: tripartite tricarboxylate transporter substrate binding protein [Hyphomicrobiales bacterium]|nr:MAG: tripartite tricarboxylate transporter substrate binding protein [Hyphomicrobiales bacterium]